MTGSEAEREGRDSSRADRTAELNDAAAAASAGDRRARDHLLELIRQPILRYCRARVGPAVRLQTGEDVAQDVLMAVVEALPRYRPSEVPAMAFIYGIARNKVADSLRASGRDKSDPTDDVPDRVSNALEPETGALRSAEARQLRVLLDMLPSSHREVLVLRVAMQFSAEETARAVGSTPGAVRVTQHRALSKLRAMMAEQLSEPAT
ncbi:RNA polymerase sigma factor ShbA [Pseudonocardia sp. CA-107938]|uniref:RNA polymerase sigma factor ShbA n=1 Tax=Pseudonocardia sp. CA-107938 TaxID=3240021 RepID=UPI003D8EB172